MCTTLHLASWTETKTGTLTNSPPQAKNVAQMTDLEGDNVA